MAKTRTETRTRKVYPAGSNKNPPSSKTNRYNTAAPTGLAISRNGGTFYFSWKCGDDDYGEGQVVQCSVNGGGWFNIPVNTTQRLTSYTLNLANYYPYKAGLLYTVSFRVQGKKLAYDFVKEKITYTKIGKLETSSLTVTCHTSRFYWSAWSQATFTLAPPNGLITACTLNENVQNQATYTCALVAANNQYQPHADYEWQSILVRESNVTDGSRLDWRAGVLGWATGTGASVTFTENQTVSCTRWVRFRSRGARGASAWAYVRHVFATPYPADQLRVSSSRTGTGYTVSATWRTPSNAAHPVDQVTVQYVITTPSADMNPPAGTSWTDVRTMAPGATGAVTFSIGQQLNPDECLWVRIKTLHDTNSDNYSAAARAATGFLADPSNLSVTLNHTTHKATVTCTNNSAVPGSFLAITYRPTEAKDAFVCGIIPAGQSTVTVQGPDWSSEPAIAFEVQAVKGSYTGKTRADGATSYALNKIMYSANTLKEGGEVPVVPSNVTAGPTETAGEILVTWGWSWNKATKAVLSWADNPNAWESTAEPTTYEVGSINASSWTIAGLETGKKWYVRVRLVQVGADGETTGPWSDAIAVDLSSAPNISSLFLDKTIIPADGRVTAAWGYVTTDGTAQASAEICEATITGEGITYGRVIARTQTAQHVTIEAQDVGWEAGNTYNLCVRVTSRSGRVSDNWSVPVPITIAEALEAEITETSLEEGILTEMPLTLTVEGAGYGGTTIVAIERAADYTMLRPDGKTTTGYAGETIVLTKQNGEEEITITKDDLIGRLDDGADYRIVATVQDGFGQSAETSMEFGVAWDEQAIIPDATAEVDERFNASIITPELPPGAPLKGHADIYRLSIDGPELVFSGAEWGETYVDPFPTIGENGGHRVVYISDNGDYITADNKLAMIDLDAYDNDLIAVPYGIIDFQGEQIPVLLNASVSNSFEKDFTETRYLGGSVVGDWNPAVRRSGSLTASLYFPPHMETADSEMDQTEVVQAVRRLAAFPGICHVRTLDGSSFAADVQVSDQISFEDKIRLDQVTFTITKIDPEGFEGMTYEEWIQGREEDEESE